MANPFTSARLLYRAIETPDDDKLFLQLNQEPESFQNSNPGLLRPQARADAMRHQKALMEHSLIGVVICLRSTDPIDPKPTAIGQIHLDAVAPTSPQHRTGVIGLGILPEYQAQGYGTEAIRWILDWGFRRAGLHRVEIRALGWNSGAIRLYERLGFVLEGTLRELWWHDGRYWDDYYYAMLDREWEEIKKREVGKGS